VSARRHRLRCVSSGVLAWPPGAMSCCHASARAVGAGAARITDAALGTLIGEYCREAGVRALKKQLEKIYRKVALRLVKRGASAKVPPRVRVRVRVV